MAEEQKTASGFGKKLSSEITDTLPYSISEESQTDSTSRHLGDINFAFQFFFLCANEVRIFNGTLF